MSDDHVREDDQPVTQTTADGKTPGTDELPDAGMDTGMDTGSAEGSPGEREPVDPADPVALAVQDDAPLPPEVARGAGSADGLDPAFRQP